MCIRCLWTAPDIAKHIDPIKKKSWQQWITDYDFTYDKALERKMNKKLKERKKLEKHSYDLFTLNFFVVLGENI
jgi:hypothetical protein